MNVQGNFAEGLKYLKIATSNQANAKAAFSEIAQQLPQEEIGFVLLFFPSQAEKSAIEEGILSELSGFTVFGASSAGQITPAGYEDEAFLALGFPKAHFHVSSLLLTDLQPFSLDKIEAQVKTHAKQFSRTAGWNRLGVLIPDGLSKQEDVLIASLATILTDVPIFGGSAAQNSHSASTLIYVENTFHHNAALLLLIETDLSFQAIQFDHFAPTDCKMVVTSALPDERLVLEINGAPAAQEYARIIGVNVDELSPELFAQHPLLFRVGEDYYVRSIAQIEDNGGLSLLCSIDVGVILTLGKAEEIVRKLDAALSAAEKEGESPEFIFAFDCFLRKLEIEQTNRVERASKVLQTHRVVGFNTYGEQHDGMHVNQTFVGVAFYKPNLTRLM